MDFRDKKSLAIISAIILGTGIMVFSNFYLAQAQSNSTEAKRDITDSIESSVGGNWSSIEIVNITKHFVDGTFTIYNNTLGTGGPSTEICGDGIDNNGDGSVDEGCSIIETPEEPTINVNTSKWFRVTLVGDVDNNGGLTNQLRLANKYNTQLLIIAGDYGYDGPGGRNGGQGVLNKLRDNHFTENNTIITHGNHDDDAKTIKWNKWDMNFTYGVDRVTDKLDVFSINAKNDGIEFKCNPEHPNQSSEQYKDLKGKMESSHTWYKLVSIHQPFVTAPSKHDDNGQFTCWDPVFKGNGINAVIQAHNHNYQRFDIEGLPYITVGTGTHDQGNAMADDSPVESDGKWKSFTCQNCIEGTNGITILDLEIDNPALRLIHGWFLSNTENVKDNFTW